MIATIALKLLEVTMSEFNKTTGLKRLINTFGYSKAGLLAAIKEPAVYQLLAVHSVLVGLALWLSFDVAIKMILVFASFLSLIVELFNTALEAAVDHTSLEIHPLAKRAKDIGSASQLVALTLVVLLWLMALLF